MTQNRKKPLTQRIWNMILRGFRKNRVTITTKKSSKSRSLRRKVRRWLRSMAETSSPESLWTIQTMMRPQTILHRLSQDSTRKKNSLVLRKWGLLHITIRLILVILTTHPTRLLRLWPTIKRFNHPLAPLQTTREAKKPASRRSDHQIRGDRMTHPIPRTRRLWAPMLRAKTLKITTNLLLELVTQALTHLPVAHSLDQPIQMASRRLWSPEMTSLSSM